MVHETSRRRSSRCWILAGALVIGAGLAYAWRVQAQAPTTTPVARGSGRLPALPVLAEAGDNAVKDMGGTFYYLEARAKKLTARFADGAAIAERGLDGNIRTRSTDAAGNETGRLSVDQTGARDAEMLYESNGSQLFYAPVRAEVRPTLDWAALQAHALRRDGHPASVQWQGRFARARSTRPGSPGNLGNVEDAVTEVVTEFDQDITARTVRVVPRPGENKRPSTLTRIYENGVEVGEIAWVPSQKLLMWSFKNLTKGSVNEDALRKTPNGGWTFQPSMAWANVQALAFYTFHGRLAKNGLVSGVAKNEPQAAGQKAGEQKSWGQKLADVVVRPVEANAPGCDGLHWLDGTVFRPCCDAHDLCYVKAGCNQYSWYWPPSMSWSCTACNAGAVYCFYSIIGGTTGTCVYMPGACSW